MDEKTFEVSAAEIAGATEFQRLLMAEIAECLYVIVLKRRLLAANSRLFALI